MAARSPGATASTSRVSGSAENTPPATGATRRSRTSSPMRVRTSSPRLTPGRVAREPGGSILSRDARSTPARPIAAAVPASVGSAGMPSTPELGRGCALRCRSLPGSWTHAPAASGTTSSASRPSSAASPGTVAERVEKDSAPLSSRNPPSSRESTLPPKRADSSRTVTCSPRRARVRAATSPATPPPTTTTGT